MTYARHTSPNSYLSSRVRSAEREKHEAQKKIKLLEQKNSILESEKTDVQRRLDEKMDEVSATVRQLAQFLPPCAGSVLKQRRRAEDLRRG